MPYEASRISVPRIPTETQAVSSGYSPKPVTDIDAAKRRIAARMAVICNNDISPRARLLYVLLDDYAGMKGVCWPKQKTLAEAMSVTRQTVNEWVTELGGAGVVKIDHLRSHCAVYVLAWAAPSSAGSDVGESRHVENDTCRELPTCGVGESRHLEPPHLLIEPGNEPAPTDHQPCARCAGHGWLAYTSHGRDGSKTKAVLCGSCMANAEEAGGWGRGDKLLRQQVLMRIG